MSEYYKSQHKLFVHLDKIIKSCEENKSDIDLKILLYDCTLTFAVSEKAIINRINKIVELNPNLKLENEVLKWVA